MLRYIKRRQFKNNKVVMLPTKGQNKNLIFRFYFHFYNFQLLCLIWSYHKHFSFLVFFFFFYIICFIFIVLFSICCVIYLFPKKRKFKCVIRVNICKKNKLVYCNRIWVILIWLFTSFSRDNIRSFFQTVWNQTCWKIVNIQWFSH